MRNFFEKLQIVTIFIMGLLTVCLIGYLPMICVNDVGLFDLNCDNNFSRFLSSIIYGFMFTFLTFLISSIIIKIQDDKLK